MIRRVTLREQIGVLFLLLFNLKELFLFLIYFIFLIYRKESYFPRAEFKFKSKFKFKQNDNESYFARAELKFKFKQNVTLREQIGVELLRIESSEPTPIEKPPAAGLLLILTIIIIIIIHNNNNKNYDNDNNLSSAAWSLLSLNDDHHSIITIELSSFNYVETEKKLDEQEDFDNAEDQVGPGSLTNS